MDKHPGQEGATGSRCERLREWKIQHRLDLLGTYLQSFDSTPLVTLIKMYHIIWRPLTCNILVNSHFKRLEIIYAVGLIVSTFNKNLFIRSRQFVVLLLWCYCVKTTVTARQFRSKRLFTERAISPSCVDINFTPCQQKNSVRSPKSGGRHARSLEGKQLEPNNCLVSKVYDTLGSHHKKKDELS